MALGYRGTSFSGPGAGGQEWGMGGPETGRKGASLRKNAQYFPMFDSRAVCWGKIPQTCSARVLPGWRGDSQPRSDNGFSSGLKEPGLLLKKRKADAWW